MTRKQILFEARASPQHSTMGLTNAPPTYERSLNEQELFEEAYKEGVKELVKENLALKAKVAIEEVKMDMVKEGQKSKEKLDELASNGQILFKASAVFPFDFFPDEITIDTSKVNIIERIFFFSEHIHSVAIKSIKDIAIETSIFFATLRVVPDGYPNNPLAIKFLPKADAIKARRIIQGLIVTDRENIDAATVAVHNLPHKIEEVGKINEVE